MFACNSRRRRLLSFENHHHAKNCTMDAVPGDDDIHYFHFTVALSSTNVMNNVEIR